MCPLCQYLIVLATLNIGVVALAVAAGSLTAALLGFVLSGGLILIGVDAGADIGLVTGVLAGLAAGGWVAGSRSRHSHRFHGMITGLFLAFLLMVIARLGGSPASLGSVLWLMALSVAVSGLTGHLAGRRKARPTQARP